MNKTPILQIKNLSVAFGKGEHAVHALSYFSLDVFAGQCVGLVGESGSGKSLTALSIMQLLPHNALVSRESEILFEHRDILSLTEIEMRKIRGHRIAIVFQDAMSALNPVLTIGEQLREGFNNVKKCLKLLDEVGIENTGRCYRSYPHELSGGMRQRVMIAMALRHNPEILIADEPTTALDVTIQAQILTLLKELQIKKNMTLLFISHDLTVVSKLADEIVVLQNGRLVEQAQANLIFQNPQQEYTKKLISSILPIQPRHTSIEESLPILQAKGLKVYFPVRSSFLKRTLFYVKAVDNISFEIPIGQTVALVGESGSGKTTTAKAILKLIPASGGEILFKGYDLLNLSRRNTKLMRNFIQIIFQDPYAALDPRMMIIDCLAEGLIALKKIRSRTEIIARVDTLLEQVQLPKDAKWRYPHEFSGGQRQRICIARALACEPKLLVLDEPTSALDASIQIQILKLLEDLQKRLNLSYLLITHNLSVVAYMAQYTIVMHGGEIVEQGTTANILEKPQHRYTKSLLSSIPKFTSPEESET